MPNDAAPPIRTSLAFAHDDFPLLRPGGGSGRGMRGQDSSRSGITVPQESGKSVNARLGGGRPTVRPGHELRVYQRAPYFGRVVVATHAETPAVEGRTFDLSIGGVGLACPTALNPAPGQSITVTFLLAGQYTGSCRERVEGRVVWVRTEPGCCLLGVEFVKLIHPGAHPALSRLMERL
jgi:hypothetical protein